MSLTLSDNNTIELRTQSSSKSSTLSGPVLEELETYKIVITVDENATKLYIN
jgi:hypothetical protein